MIKTYDPKQDNLRKWTRRNIYRLQHLGALMMIIGPVIPFLNVIKVIPASYGLGLVSWLLMFLGGTAYIIGMVWDNLVDRSE
jgi:predicted membrane channel-forming protein YqfA (hemolysin III family)